MTITNKNNLPDILVYCAQALADEYDRDPNPNSYSVTELIAPVHQTYLIRQNYDNLEDDVSNRLWAMEGQAIHILMDIIGKSYPERFLTEKRLEFTIMLGSKEYTVRGKFDGIDLELSTLYDNKREAVYGLIKNPKGKPEQIKQINIYAYMIERLLGIKVNNQNLNLFLYDWKKLDAKINKYGTYPQRNLIELPIVKLEKEQVESLITELLIKHTQYQGEICTPGERWHKPDEWKVVSNTSGKSVKNCDSETEAREHKSKMSTGNNYHIEFSKGEDTRCMNYCIVKDYCNYYKQTYGVNNDTINNNN